MSFYKKMTYAATASASVVLAGTMVAGNASAMTLQERAESPSDNAMWGMNYQAHRFSEMDEINRDNVSDLVPAWTFSTGVLRGHEGSPLVIDDTMYIHTPFPNDVIAVDLNTQEVKWTYEPDQDSDVIGVMCCDTVYRGLGYGDGIVVLQQADTTVVGLDADTGEELWTHATGDPDIGETATAAPQVIEEKNLVLTGISGGEFGVRGRIHALNLETGEMEWKAYSTGPDDEMKVDPNNTTYLGEPVGANTGLDTWPDDEWQRGGGTTWGWTSYDPELELIYYGTGNPGTWNPIQRTIDGEPADNRYSMTIFARDVNTGTAEWVFLKTPFDEWDYDGINENILFDAEFDGEERKLLFNAERNGFGLTLDRVTGELLVAEKYEPHVNWATHWDMETGRPVVNEDKSTFLAGENVNVEDICPAALGSKNQAPVSYSHNTGLMYIPVNHVCMDYEPYRVQYTAGQPYVGATLRMHPGPSGQLGRVTAWDPIEGERVWYEDEKFSVWSGMLSTAGDVLFHGTMEGYLKARDAETGEELWKFRTPSGIIGNVFTYEHDGRQYVGVLSGVGGWAGIGMAAGLTGDTEGLGAVGAYRELYDHTRLGGTLTVFALPN